jgi:hypothetical protein
MEGNIREIFDNQIQSNSRHLLIDLTKKDDEYSPYFNFKNQELLSRISKTTKVAKWTPKDDEKLSMIIQSQGLKNWKKISEYFENKTPIQCFYRWKKVLKPSLIENEWTEEEDKFISEWANTHGTTNWTNCSKLMKGRNPKNCRDRWASYLSLKFKGECIWNPFDEIILLLSVQQVNTSWSRIKRIFPGKNENAIKNKFYSILRKTVNIHMNKGEQRFNVFNLKLNELIYFIPIALNDLKNIVGELIYLQTQNNFTQNYIQILENNINSSNNINNINNINNNNLEHLCFKKEEIDNKTKVYMCSSCLAKLREEIKRRLIKKYINSEQINSNLVGHYDIFSDWNRLKNTNDKIQNVKEIIEGFTLNYE